MNLEERLQRMSFAAVLTMSLVLGLALLALAIAFLEGAFDSMPMFVEVLLTIVTITTIAWFTVQVLNAIKGNDTTGRRNPKATATP